jgi:hypothetical protein
MAAAEKLRMADRLVVALVPVTLEMCPPPEYFRDEQTIACVDLDSLGPEKTIRWVNEASEETSLDRNETTPCVIVIGSLANLSEDEAERLESSLIDDGAVIFERPEGQSFPDAYKALLHRLNNVYSRFSRTSSGTFRSLEAPKLDEERRRRWQSHTAGSPPPDLAEYLSSPSKLREEEFDALAERTDMAEDDPEFDD